MCSAVVGIHGIGQHKTTSSALEEAWHLAMLRGVERSGRSQRVPSLKMAFYGSSFHRPDGRLGPTNQETALSLDEELFIEEVLSSSIFQGIDVDENSARELGLPAIPGKVARLLVRVDRKFGRNTGKYLLYILRQVYRYLTNAELSEEIRNVVAATISPETQIVFAHSLGSVVAYDMAQRGELFPESLDNGSRRQIITFGSPLSWPTVHRMLGYGQAAVDMQAIWHNLYDTADAVTGGQGLTGESVQNVKVRNGLRDPHAAVMYLRQPAVGSLLTTQAGI
ncbi:hypothetical protein ACFY30_16425 [Streptomyces sp. NPDC000345]|uniref:hypothetical protein n=1 Tax=Streptomyces sp. NPDC000345 TaxID=3364537 RepID=UPI00369A5EE9